MDNIFRLSEQMLEELDDELISSVYLEAGLRLELVHECCDIAIEHGVAIQHLLELERDISAIALFRMQFEAVVRAYWLLMVATNNEVQKFEVKNEAQLFQNIKILSVTEMITKLEGVKEIEHIVEMFKEFKFYSLKHLHSVVHTGRNSLIQKRAGLSDEFRITLIRQVNGFITMAAQILLRHAGKEKYLHYIHGKYGSCFQMQEDISAEEKQRIDSKFAKYQ
ncbi:MULTISPECIES: DUF6988 family protein [unclassified Acinetobacter]|uniref:DUF6988 family protein n=1 Tax=Acinetobacter TaxID=469 RepID=UPI000CDC6874|nr:MULTISPECIES: hypothetical protein [unclassified Acinetobacter]AUX89372.1 hypothetical protein C3F22_05670 [Acinetobacter sp. ACNIH1]QKW83111.1 hypothetical protein FOC32_12880 [Acinetobacter sp. FDAARGOS_724]